MSAAIRTIILSTTIENLRCQQSLFFCLTIQGRSINLYITRMLLLLLQCHCVWKEIEAICWLVVIKFQNFAVPGVIKIGMCVFFLVQTCIVLFTDIDDTIFHQFDLVTHKSSIQMRAVTVLRINYKLLQVNVLSLLKILEKLPISRQIIRFCYHNSL